MTLALVIPIPFLLAINVGAGQQAAQKFAETPASTAAAFNGGKVVDGDAGGVGTPFSVAATDTTPRHPGLDTSGECGVELAQVVAAAPTATVVGGGTSDGGPVVVVEGIAVPEPGKA